MPTVGSSGINSRGTYSAGTKYFPGDLVSYNNNAYMAAVVTTGNLPTNPAFWSLMTTVGGVGATGSSGTAGLGTGMPALVSGTYYCPQSRTNPLPGAVPMAKDYACYLPFSTSYACTVNFIGVGMSSLTTGSALVRTAIYNADPTTGVPSTRFLLDTGQNTFVGGSAAQFLGGCATTTIPAGNYWAAIAVGYTTTTTGNVFGFTATDAIRVRGYIGGTDVTGSTTNSYLTISDTTSYTATGFPATAPAFSSMTATGLTMPAFFWKIA